MKRPTRKTLLVLAIAIACGFGIVLGFLVHLGFSPGRDHVDLVIPDGDHPVPHFVAWDRYCEEDIPLLFSNGGSDRSLHQLVSPTPVRMYPTTKRSEELPAAIRKFEDLGYRLRQNPVFEIGTPFDWGANPLEDRNWHFKVNSLPMVVPYLQLYEIDGDESWLEIPRAVLKDWIDFNLDDDRPNKFKWYDMSTGLRAVLIAVLVQHESRIHPEGEFLNKLVYAADVHVDVLATPELLSPGNHGLFQMVGLASLCRALPDLRSCVEAEQFMNDGMKEVVSGQFSDEGIHLEHSLQYHPWAIRVLEDIRFLGLFDDTLFDVIERAKENTRWMYLPNGYPVQFGDTERGETNRISNAGVPATAADDKERTGSHSEFFRIFKKSGYAFFRSEWDPEKTDRTSYLAVTGAFHSSTHKQADDLTFDWSDAGRELLVDSGKYSYDSGPFTEFFRSTRAHNTVEIDGRDSPTGRNAAFGSAVVDGDWSDGRFRVRLRVDRPSWGVSHERSLVLSPGRWLAVVDVFEASHQHTYTQWFHFAPELSARIEDECVAVSTDAGKILTLTSVSSRSISRVRHRGNEQDPIQGWISYEYLEKQPRDSVGIQTTGSDVVLASVFSLADRPDHLEFTTDSERIQIQWQYGGQIEGFTLAPLE